VAGRGRCYQCEVERAWHGGELRQQSWCAVTVCFDLETIAMWWRRSAAVQWRKVDDAVEEMASAVQRSSGSVLVPKMEEGEWGIWLVATQREGWRGVRLVSATWHTLGRATAMTRAWRHQVAHGRGRGRERRERAGEAGEWSQLVVGPS
jgi:hypothetical protein